MPIENKNAGEVLSACRTFYNTQRTKSIPFRLLQLRKLYSAVHSHQKALSRALWQDLHKSPFEAYETEIGFVLSSIRAAVRELSAWAAEQPVPTPFYLSPGKSRLLYEPYGTVLIIGAYNYPVQLLLEPLVGALAAGNCAVLKPSELTPHVSAALSRMIADTFPARYVRCVEGGADAASALLCQPFDYFFFTGSRRVGQIVMQAAAEHLAPVTLELGGKSPVIVDKTADLDCAARRIIWGKTLNAGQTCVAPDYLLVQEALLDPLVDRMRQALLRFYPQGAQASASYGRIVNARHFARLQKILDADQKLILCGGKSCEKTLYMEPTLLLAHPDAACMQEEIFGPLLPILPYRRLSEALELVHSLPHPLALYLFSKDEPTKKRVLREVPAGGVCINGTVEQLANPYLPFGGTGASGMGSYHGKYSFLLFSHGKSVMEKGAVPWANLLFPPYREGTLQLIKKVLR